MHDDYDRSSKWVIQHHGDAILHLAGVRGIRSWRPLQAELVQPKQLPDGLIEAMLEGRDAPSLYILEIATYPEERVQEQVLRDALLVYLDRRVIPEVLTLVLCRHGNASVSGTHQLESPEGWTRFRIEWRVVHLWNVPAQELLATNEVGLIPWVPLTQFDGAPEPILHECRQRIDRQAQPEERDNLLAVIQVLTRLRYNDQQLLAIFGGKTNMIQSPLIQEIVAERMQKSILRFLEARFLNVPADLASQLNAIQDEQKLDELTTYAATCPDLEAFRANLPQ